MEHQEQLSETEKILRRSPIDEKFEPDYLDEDMLIIDNLKLMVDSRPTKLNMNIIAICTKGKLQMKLNQGTVELNENETFICPPNMIFTDVMVSTDFEYAALAITNRALQSILRSYMEIWNSTVYVNKIYVIPVENGDLEFYQKFYDLIGLCLDPPEGRKSSWFQYRNEILRGLITAGLVGLCNMLNNHVEGNRETPQQQSISLFNRFLQLLQTQKIKHQPVEYYAAELCITPKYLTVICKKNSGKTANEWIREYTLSDITYQLSHTNLSIKEISNHTGFPNSSFFGKYVKEHLGCTPVEYRNHKEMKAQ